MVIALQQTAGTIPALFLLLFPKKKLKHSLEPKTEDVE